MNAAAILEDACLIGAAPRTPSVERRFVNAMQEAVPFARECGSHVAAVSEIDPTEPLIQPELIGAEALWDYLRGEAVLLEGRIKSWLNVGETETPADEALQFALAQLTHQLIAEVAASQRRSRPAA
jgi:hypothetical protein